jgi:hypothetical protein
VEIAMPKKLVLEIFRGYHNRLMDEIETEKSAPELQAPPEGEMVQSMEEPGGSPNAAQ